MAKKMAENFNRLCRVHEHYRQTDDRQTDRQTEQRMYIANVNASSCSLMNDTWILIALQSVTEKLAFSMTSTTVQGVPLSPVITDINVKKLQFMHTVNGDGSKTAKIIKRQC